MADDGGVWVKVYPDAAGGAPGAAQIGGHNGATVDRGKVIDGKTYDIYTFTDDTATDLSLTVSEAGLADILVVGGGGPGGSNQPSGYYAGCGGGGGVLTTVIGDAGGRGTQGETSIVPRYLNKGVYEINVGAGGQGTAWTGSPALNGDATSFGLAVAYGGGRGTTVRNGGTWVSASDGASGGGGGGLGMERQGFDAPGSGGGGAGSESSGNAGGDGVISNITGSPVPYGAGGEVNGEGTPGSPNTGNGGSNGNPGGNGGSGIVIVRVEV